MLTRRGLLGALAVALAAPAVVRATSLMQVKPPVPWSLLTKEEILADINSVLNEVWAKTGHQIVPDALVLPPDTYRWLSGATIHEVANTEIPMQTEWPLKAYLEENTLSNTTNGHFEIVPGIEKQTIFIHTLSVLQPDTKIHDHLPWDGSTAAMNERARVFWGRKWDPYSDERATQRLLGHVKEMARI